MQYHSTTSSSETNLVKPLTNVALDPLPWSWTKITSITDHGLLPNQGHLWLTEITKAYRKLSESYKLPKLLSTQESCIYTILLYDNLQTYAMGVIDMMHVYD